MRFLKVLVHRHGRGDRGGDDGADRADRAPDRGRGRRRAAVATSVLLEEPAGTRIAAIAAVGDRLAVQLQGGGADRFCCWIRAAGWWLEGSGCGGSLEVCGGLP